MANKSKVAVIGLGSIGSIVAANLVKGKREVIIADRKIDKANSLAQQLGNLAIVMEIDAALQAADIIILAIWFSAIKEFMQQHAKALQGKIIIDPSNPIGPDEKGSFKKLIPQNESAGEINAAALPANTKIAKALGTLKAASLDKAAFDEPRAVLFYATDDTDINHEIEQLIKDNGFEPLRVGDMGQSIRIEVFGDLHEMGGLGKTVTLAEGKGKV